MDTDKVDVNEMNEKVAEATAFITFMAEALRNNLSVDDEKVVAAVEQHIAFLQNDHSIDAKDFAAQSRFLIYKQWGIR
ncbi:hypothetical protein [Brevibacillus sp. NRS-1366]|uniref:hypothetical protein n=1 Tax=Brevibacillus sp. NRS-1366 TaxID=3233899 RepID=UPI003D1DC6CF